VTFHANVVFVNCSFKKAVVDENGPSVDNYLWAVNNLIQFIHAK
jgi:hypothetical protein